MKIRSRNISASMVVLVIACSMAGSAPMTAFAAKPSLDGKSNLASASGSFTGTLTGVITIGNREVLITEKTTIYRPGHGAVKLRTFVTNGKVYATGVLQDGLLIARIVMLSKGAPSLDVRPLTEEHLIPGSGDVTQ